MTKLEVGILFILKLSRTCTSSIPLTIELHFNMLSFINHTYFKIDLLHQEMIPVNFTEIETISL